MTGQYPGAVKITTVPIIDERRSTRKPSNHPLSRNDRPAVRRRSLMSSFDVSRKREREERRIGTEKIGFPPISCEFLRIGIGNVIRRGNAIAGGLAGQCAAVNRRKWRATRERRKQVVPTRGLRRPSTWPSDLWEGIFRGFQGIDRTDVYSIPLLRERVTPRNGIPVDVESSVHRDVVN